LHSHDKACISFDYRRHRNRRHENDRGDNKTYETCWPRQIGNNCRLHFRLEHTRHRKRYLEQIDVNK
jgi:hypothetical protein